MKYVIFQSGDAIIFGDFASHKDMAGNRPVMSAGFCMVETFRNQFDDIRAKVSVWGKSDSLHVESNQRDSEVLAAIFR